MFPDEIIPPDDRNGACVDWATLGHPLNYLRRPNIWAHGEVAQSAIGLGKNLWQTPVRCMNTFVRWVNKVMSIHVRNERAPFSPANFTPHLQYYQPPNSDQLGCSAANDVDAYCNWLDWLKCTPGDNDCIQRCTNFTVDDDHFCGYCNGGICQTVNITSANECTQTTGCLHSDGQLSLLSPVRLPKSLVRLDW